MTITHHDNKAIPLGPRVEEAGINHFAALAKAIRKRQGERVRDARKKAGLTIEALADRTGLHFNTVGRIERGESEADLEHLLMLAHALSVQAVHLAPFEVPADAQPLDDDEFALVDMLDVKASAGKGAMNGHHETIGRFAFKRSWLQRRGVRGESAKIIRARGDSMADRINDGDILLVNTAVTHLEQDGVYVIEQDGLDYVKLLQRDFANGGVQIISYNPAYKAQRLTSEQAAELRISGRVVWHAGEL